MSLGVVVKGPEGIVLAADTRITLTAQQGDGPPMSVNFDNARKLLSFAPPHNWVSAVTYGGAVIGGRTAHSYIPEFEVTLGDERLRTADYAERLSAFFQKRWREADMPQSPPEGSGMTFIVGGYDEGEPYGSVFIFDVPTSPAPTSRNDRDDFGLTWGGQLRIASRIIHGFDPALLAILRERLDISDEQVKELQQLFRSRLQYAIPFGALPLQDCVDLATFLIRTTITAQNLAVALRGVGGTIEVATITRTQGLEWVQRRELRGENL